MINLVGEDQARAETLLRQNGLEVGSVTPETSDTQAAVR